MPKVSVLVPVYNVEKDLRECLDSLINQTLEDIEIICINDGSTDSSAQILEEYRTKDKRIRIIHKTNTGYGNSMNIGLNNARGEYVGILESDDFTEKNMYEDLYNLAKEYDADIVKSDWYCYWTQKNDSRKCGKISPKKSNKIINALQEKSLLKLQPSIWSAVYKRDFLNSNNLNFLETPGASYQDTSFYLKSIISAQKIVLTPKAYVHYRQDNLNSSCRSREKVFAICNEFNEVENFIQSNPEYQTEFQEYIYAIQYRAYFATMMRIDERYVDDFLEVFSNKFRELYNKGCLGGFFFSRNNKQDVLCLINNKKKFLKIYQREMKKSAREAKRRGIISVRLNDSRLSVSVFNKELVRIG